ncbi:MAG: hypothetical protein OXF58_10700, partial [Gammaproteobacteria bacterium]|nr:hypothetical protein [Gammaproteobacteria bacterium]
ITTLNIESRKALYYNERPQQGDDKVRRRRRSKATSKNATESIFRGSLNRNEQREEFAMTSLNVTTIVDTVNKGISAQTDKIADMLNNMDVTDPTAMLKLQAVEGNFEALLKMSSAMVSDFKNTVTSIAQKA